MERRKMPFKSEKQRRLLWTKRPDIAEKWSKESGVKKKKYKDGGVVEEESWMDWMRGTNKYQRGETASEDNRDKTYQGDFSKKKAKREALRKIIKDHSR